MRLTLVGDNAYDGSAPKAAPSRLINVYGETAGDKRILRGVPGFSAFADLPNTGLVAMSSTRGVLYAVIAGGLYSISSGGAVTRLGSVPQSTETYLDSNNGAVTVVADGRYFVWDGQSLSEPATGAFAEFGDVAFFGQRTVLLERGGRRVQWSGLAAPKELGGTDFATTETRDDNNLRAISAGGALYILKERSTEVWSSDGQGPGVVPGSTRDIGLLAAPLAVQIPDGLVWVSDAGRVVTSSFETISTPAVERSILNDGPQRLAYYSRAGAAFVCIIFAGRPAWCINLRTGEWHERAGGVQGPWDVAGMAELDGAYYVGRANGRVDRVGGVKEGDDALVRGVVTRTLENSGQRLTVSEIRLDVPVGEFDGASLMLRMSKDQGRTWGQWRVRDLGGLGQHQRQVVFRRLGQYRTANAEIVWTTPHDLFLGADAEVRVT